MDHRLQDLYDLPPQDMYLLELAEQCGRLEARLLDMMEQLPVEQMAVIESYIEIRNELDFQSVKRALKFGKQSRGSL